MFKGRILIGLLVMVGKKAATFYQIAPPYELNELVTLGGHISNK
jgi:hypothetical protein